VGCDVYATYVRLVGFPRVNRETRDTDSRLPGPASAVPVPRLATPDATPVLRSPKSGSGLRSRSGGRAHPRVISVLLISEHKTERERYPHLDLVVSGTGYSAALLCGAARPHAPTRHGTARGTADALKPHCAYSCLHKFMRSDSRFRFRETTHEHNISLESLGLFVRDPTLYITHTQTHGG
jgi:hypothetical protein